MFKVNINFDMNAAKGKPLKAVERGLKLAGESILKVSNEKVPLDKGDLQTSGEVMTKGTELVISYNEPYAVRLHENPQYNFQGGREGKWLENTLKDKQVQKDFVDILANAIKGEL